MDRAGAVWSPSYTQTSGPAPAPSYHVDPNTLRRDYANRLAAYNQLKE